MVTFVGLYSVDLHIARVQNRHRRGGHNIPVESIQHRFETAPQNLIELMPVLKELQVWDDSAPALDDVPQPVKLLHIRNARIEFFQQPQVNTPWMQDVLVAAQRLDSL